ncbi:MAG: L-2-hydroxyglutarate oxidase [Halobacteriaceae archaeon]
MVHHDVAVIGGGVVGLSTALHAAELVHGSIAVLEKEEHLGQHQSGRNSGVLHPGFNYEPGSMRAEFAVEGTRRAKAFCRDHDVPLEKNGVVVVATDPAEERHLETLAAQAEANGVTASVVDEHRLAELEPHADGRAALYCPSAAAIDSQSYLHALASEARNAGVRRYMSTAVTDIEPLADGYRLGTSSGEFRCSYLVNAAGLGADRLAHEVGVGEEYRIIPFRGEYREVVPDRRSLCRSMIYPTPDPELPFLGVHFTTRTDGRVIIGPNAVLAFGREAYDRYDIDLGDIVEMLEFPGFWRLLSRPKMARIAATELHKTYRHERFVAAARELVPGLRTEDVVDSYAGVRAQLVSEDGTLIHDPRIVDAGRATHVLNAVSPGLTASLPMGEHLAERVARRL